MAHAAPRERGIPSLDGLRAISIGLVLVSHYALTTNALVSNVLAQWIDVGRMGVRLFFVISGFLITTLLLAEYDRTGAISLAKFYWRRSMRIFPPYYLYLALVATLFAFGAVNMTRESLWAALLYCTNYFREPQWLVGHSWSLAVEEQFYLLWPAALVLAGRKRGWAIAAAVIVLCPVIRLVEYHTIGDTGIGYRFESTADALATGCLLAYLRGWLGTNALYARMRATPVMYLLPLVIVAASALDEHPHLAYVVGIPVANLAMAVFIDWVVRDANTAAFRVLNTAPLMLIGRMSYSIYLWQQLFLKPTSAAWPQRSPYNIPLALIAASLSYALVEQPVLRLRQRLERARARPRDGGDAVPTVPVT